MASSVKDCDCGFVDSNDPTSSVFSNFLAIRFASLSDGDFERIFIPASYDIDRDEAPYLRAFSPDQLDLSEDGLNITVSPPDGDDVPCGQIFTHDRHFFYGAYHLRLRPSAEAGTTTAFFNYHNDTSEVDIEYLNAWDEPTLLYTIKPQIYDDRGNPDNSTYQRQSWTGGDDEDDDGSQALRTAYSQEVHDWSFIWLPDIVHFGMDNSYDHNVTTNVPQAPGRVAVSQWSDGNGNYSLGPPKSDSTIQVASLWAVFNKTSDDEVRCDRSSVACTITDGVFQRGDTSGGGSGDDGDDEEDNGVTESSSAAVVLGPTPNWRLAFLFFFWFGIGRLL